METFKTYVAGTLHAETIVMNGNM
nr:hypothetical protein [Tanacetum cinerariifolium]